VSAKKNLPSLQGRRRLLLKFIYLLVFVFIPFAARADSLEDATRAFARRVVSRFKLQKEAGLGYGWTNSASISLATSERMRNVFEAELRNLGFNVNKDSPRSSGLRVRVADNPSSLVLIAQFGADSSSVPIMMSVPKSPPLDLESPRLPVQLNRQLLWQQTEPILDASELNDSAGKPQVLLVLNKSTLMLYRREKDALALKDTAPLPRTNFLLRDARGEILINDHFFQFHLPGFECDGDAFQKLAFDCEADMGIWQAEFDPMIPFSIYPDRNYFAPSPHYIGPEKTPIAGFFSSAVQLGAGDNEGVLTGADGHVYAFTWDYRTQTVESLDRLPTDLGSEIVSLRPDCVENSLILTTGAGDRTVPDVLRVFALERLTMTPMSLPMEFPGPILSLRKETEFTAIVIISNLTTGNYEVYRVKLGCEN